MNNLIEFWLSMSVLGRIELVVFVGAMFFYIRHMVLNKDFTPHPIAFGIWLIADVANYITYVSFSKYWIGPLIMPLSALIVVSWGTVKLIRAKHKGTKAEKIKLGWIDFTSIVVSAVSLLVYFLTGDSLLANLMIQVILFIGFVPIVTDLIKTKRTDEPDLPWILFCVGWAVTTVEVSLGYTSWVEFIYPVVNGLIGCAVVLYLSLRNKDLASKL